MVSFLGVGVEIEEISLRAFFLLGIGVVVVKFGKGRPVVLLLTAIAV